MIGVALDLGGPAFVRFDQQSLNVAGQGRGGGKEERPGPRRSLPARGLGHDAQTGTTAPQPLRPASASDAASQAQELPAVERIVKDRLSREVLVSLQVAGVASRGKFERGPSSNCASTHGHFRKFRVSDFRSCDVSPRAISRKRQVHRWQVEQSVRRSILYADRSLSPSVT